jgi:hypothetical protein
MAEEENNFFNLPLYGPDLLGLSRQGKDTYQLGRSIMFNVMKYCCFDEMHTVGLRSNPICFLSSSFFFPLF